jgi:hypothetical protein
MAVAKPWPQQLTLASPALQITINRPEKRNAFTPRTGGPRFWQRSGVRIPAYQLPNTVAALLVLPMQSWRCPGASQTPGMTPEWESSS